MLEEDELRIQQALISFLDNVEGINQEKENKNQSTRPKTAIQFHLSKPKLALPDRAEIKKHSVATFIKITTKKQNDTTKVKKSQPPPLFISHSKIQNFMPPIGDMMNAVSLLPQDARNTTKLMPYTQVAKAAQQLNQKFHF